MGQREVPRTEVGWTFDLLRRAGVVIQLLIGGTLSRNSVSDWLPSLEADVLNDRLRREESLARVPRERAALGETHQVFCAMMPSIMSVFSLAICWINDHCLAMS